MKCMRSSIAALLSGLLFISVARAQEPIKCGRTPDISPDGRLVAFSYLGDIWIVEAIGGIARPVTMHEAYDVSPVFSPDGRMLAFTSNRHGGYDVFVVAAQGGRPKRLTFDSAADVVNGWSADGRHILFSSNRSNSFPSAYELYMVPVDGGRVQRVSVAEGREGSISPRGDQIAYVRGPGTWYRKGYRGSSNDDLWLCNADGSNNRRLTDFIGQDNSPMWGPDGQSLYYVSECHGTPANIVRLDLASKAPPQQITHHKEDGIRRARISGNGEWIVYECGADLWISPSRGGTARKLAVEVHADDKSNTERLVTYTQGATEFALAPDEKHIAFVVHGEVFLMPISGGKATRMTDSPAYDHGLFWAPDGKKIIFLSDRNGHEDIYALEPDDPEHPELIRAHRFKVTQLTKSPAAEYGIGYSPDGKRIGYLSGGRLWTMNADGTDAKPLVNEVTVFDYEWSPDGKWVVFARTDGSFASELYIVGVKSDGTAAGPGRNVTRYATYNGGVTWSADGKKIGFLSQRRRTQAMYVLSLQRPAVTGAPASTDIDFDDIHLRVTQPAAISADEGAVSNDGLKVAFRSTASGGDDLWVANANGSSLSRVTTGSQRPTRIQWSKRLTDLIYFQDGTGNFRMAKLGFSSEAVRVPFTARMMVRRDEEFGEMFEQSWRALLEHFYDQKFHGVDWNAVRDKYRPLVKHVATKEDLYALISLMLGELNASHLGITGFGSVPDEATADLGLLFDESYRGPGLRIAEVLKRGPADRRGLDLKPGEIITGIDRVNLTEQTNVSQLLNGKAGEVVVLQVASNPADPKTRRRVEVTGARRDQISSLMYERWVEANARKVSELSKGTLGYIHIPGMDDAGLDRFVRSLYSDNFDKEAIVIDVRFNSGGFTHDQVLNYLGAKEHTFFRQRYGGEGSVLRSYDRKWAKPLVLLINNRSYSDAEIFPNAFRTLGLGKLVGQATGGHVIGTSAIRLIDGSSFRIPRTGVFTASGVNMEKEGVAPDVRVDVHPDELARGMDRQLETAVKVLLDDVAAWKKTRPGVALKPEEARPTPVAPAPLPGTK